MSEGLRHSLTKVGKILITHPILLGIYTGMLLNASGLTIAGPYEKLRGFIAGSAAPCALIAIGMALNHYKIADEVLPAVTISIFKLIIHPLLVFIFSKHVFTMPTAWSSVCVLFATCPSGINAYLMAKRVGMGEEVASSALSISTFAGMLTMPVWLYFLQTWP